MEYIRRSLRDGSASLIGLLFVAVSIRIDLIAPDRSRSTRESPREYQAIARALELLAPTKIVSITLLVSGALFAFGVRDRRYALIIPVLIALTGGVTSAWLFLTKITTEQNAPNAERTET